jgi:hypothetical protein
MRKNTNKQTENLDIAMNEGFGVKTFETSNHLISQHQRGFEREFATTHFQSFFEIPA